MQEQEGPKNEAAIKCLQEELGLLLEQEDLKWKQRAKRNWYQAGDKNTKYNWITNKRSTRNALEKSG